MESWSNSTTAATFRSSQSPAAETEATGFRAGAGERGRPEGPTAREGKGGKRERCLQ